MTTIISLLVTAALATEPLPQSTAVWAKAQNDIGRVEDDVRLTHLTVVLKRAPERQQAFEEFLRQQQDPASPNFHRWLDAAQIGEWFGVPQEDIAAVTSWLEAQGLRVDAVSNSRTRIRFSGTADKVGAAFGAALRKYAVNGEQRVAISDSPRIPASLASIVQAVDGLHSVNEEPLVRIGPND